MAPSPSAAAILLILALPSIAAGLSPPALSTSQDAISHSPEQPVRSGSFSPAVHTTERENDCVVDPSRPECEGYQLPAANVTDS
ncbi:hypothetical protein HK102_004094, partial [Quaeritorhiza haematococci]